MNVFTYARPLREALATFNALRRLGFLAEDIYFHIGSAVQGAHQVCIVLKTQEKQFVVDLGFIQADREKIAAAWNELAEACQDQQIDSEQLSRMWQQSAIYNDPAALVTALINKGFYLPKAREQRLRKMN